ncbi:RHS repeat domain-containing protein [Snodgrassella alvi]|uniref:RHS repeat domain-containing protein n=1 Tax=Snodgrassella alvi TaxID=1196083 RepID=UPI00352DF728
MQVAYGWAPDSDWGTRLLWQANLNEGRTLKNASYHYLITDHLGTPQLAINSTGKQSWKINSDAFGNSELDANNQITMNLRYPGQYYDEETGLTYNYFRDYDAKTGRYIQSDPIGLAGGINTYGYVGGNPLVYSDPTGEYAQVIMPVLIGATIISACVVLPACNKFVSDSLYGLYQNIKNRNEELGSLPSIAILNKTKTKNKRKKGKECNEVDIDLNSSSNSPNGDCDPKDSDCKREFKKRISKQSGKEAADDTPDWARGKPPYKDETPEQYAIRLIKEKYGKDTVLPKSKKGAKSEYSQIKKAWRGYK